MKIVITGAGGQVGSALYQRFHTQPDHQVHGLRHADLDIGERKACERQLRNINPDLVINAAAYTAVDQAEKEPDRCYRINRDAVKHIAEICGELDCALIHFSTDYIFSGKQNRPYIESDPPDPLNVYGLSKWEGEQQIRQILEKHLILRLSWVNGWTGKNFLNTMLSLATSKKELKIVSDQQGSPTFTDELALRLDQILPQLQSGKHWGTYHFCQPPMTTWYDFANEIISVAKAYRSLTVEKVTPIKTDAYPTLAKRPAYSVLDTTYFRQTFSVELNTWKSTLGELFALNH